MHFAKLRRNRLTKMSNSRLGGNVRSSVYNYALRSPRSPKSLQISISSSAGTPHVHYRRRRRSSCPSTPGSSSRLPRSRSDSLYGSPIARARARKAPPPPLDLSKVSSFNLRKAEATSRKRKAAPRASEPVIVGKASKILLNPMEREIHTRAAETGLKLLDVKRGGTVRKTVRGILRSVRSISNMRSAAMS